jgi:hypothetical protein
MSRSKKIFFFGLAVFVLALIYLSYDISQRTSFPGSKSQLKERLKQKYLADSVREDSLMKMKEK